MIHEKIDLYTYFNIKRKAKEKGILTIYVRDNSFEVNPKRLYPGVLICPGGGYVYTSFREAEPVALKFLNNNYQSFVLDYTCSYQGEYPAQLLEGYMALKYLTINSKRFNLDLNKLGIIGFSAGGHYSCMISNFYKKEEYKELLKGCPKFSFGAYIYPVINYNKVGSHNDSFVNLTKNHSELINSFNIEDMINKESPLAFIVSTFEDKCVGYQQSLSLVSTYSKLNLPFEVHIFNKGDHGMSLANESVYETTNLDKEKETFSIWFNLLLKFLKLNKISLDD